MTTHPSTSGDRNPGLDLLRCCAILPVMIYHTPLANAPLEQMGYIGVEIFFSLSGVLVLKMIAERFDCIRSADTFTAFLMNRWMRTFPLYFLFLALNIVISKNVASLGVGDSAMFRGFANLPDIAPFLTFTQNLVTGGLKWNHNWFGVSWSLSLEEWFYVLLPAALLLLRRRNFMPLAVSLLGAIIVASIAARTARYISTEAGDFEDLFRRPVLLRLDAFCYGALVYVAMTLYAGWMHRNRMLLAGFGYAGLVVALVNGPEPGALNIFNAVAYYVVAPASVALLLPYFYHRAFDNRLVTRAAYFISSRTYALYLCHLPVCLFVTLLVPSFPAVTLAPLLAVNFVVADLLYRFVEKPILRRRPHGVVARTRAAQAVAQTAGSA